LLYKLYDYDILLVRLSMCFSLSLQVVTIAVCCCSWTVGPARLDTSDNM